MISNWWHQALTRKPSTFRRAKSAGQPRRFRPLLELLEDRNLMATITVNSLTDEIDHNAEDIFLTLREAIILANSNDASILSSDEKLLVSGTLGIGDTIVFDIAGGDTITITSANGGALPGISEQLTIDGLNTDTGNTNIVLTNDDTFTGDGLTLITGASSSIIRGLVINGFEGNGIVIETGVSKALIEGNFIGTNVDGDTAVANTKSGILVDGSGNNTIGGTGGVGLGAGLGNLISGNGVHGVAIKGTGGDGNQVVGNFIGTDVTGTKDLGNVEEGVVLALGASGNTIGGTNAGEGNLISGNNKNGILLTGSGVSDNQVLGNFIGTQIDGVTALGNSADGVQIDSATSNTIGGIVAGAGNVISGNRNDGVDLRGATSQKNVVAGNFIGLGSDGDTPLGNGANGVRIDAADDNTFGGSSSIDADGKLSGAGNVISDNGFFGVAISNGAEGNLVQGNFIGTDVTGTAGRGNGFDGVTIEDSDNNTVGGASKVDLTGNLSGLGNLISDNGQSEGGNGIAFFFADGNVAAGNFIGTDVTGTLDLGNTDNGVLIFEGSGNTVGGLNAGEGNLISGNGSGGVRIEDDPFSDVDTSFNLIQGNYIGTQIDGVNPLSNDGNGVAILDFAGTSATFNTIGGPSGAGPLVGVLGTDAFAGNLISGNAENGVLLDGSGVHDNFIQGNFIGTDVTGTGPLGNGLNGIAVVNGAAKNTIGGVSTVDAKIGLSGAGNLISNNIGDGILIDGADSFSGSATASNQVQGNFIGTDVLGQADLGNGGNGVTVINSPLNLIGGIGKVDDGGGKFLGNLISSNGENGIEILGSGATGNLVQGNFIGTNVTGKLDRGNLGNGVEIDGATSTQVGGVGLGNLIAGNGGDGVLITSGRSNNVVQGNTIGGAPGLGNVGNGVAITNGDSFNTIGGDLTGQGNLISFNGLNGVLVGISPTDSTTGNSILGNSIFANGGLGIDLGNDGVTPNDSPADADKGPNTLQNFPTLLAAVLVGPNLVIFFTIDDFPVGVDFRIEFFASNLPDPSGFGEGQIFLGFNVQSNGTFVPDPEIFAVPIFVGANFSARFITATATDASDGFFSTSEFSNVVALPIVPDVPVDPVDLVDPPIDNDPIIVDILEGDPPQRILLPIFVVTFQTFSISAVPPPPTLRQVKVLTPLVPDRLQNLVDAPGEIHGQILDDPNALGKAGPDTFPLHGQPVFLDFNRNGEYDDGEPITVTNAKGEYTFTSLTSGQYTVHLLLGRTQDVTFGPKQDNKVELRSGSMIITNVNFGVRFRARRRLGGGTALPWHTDGVLLAAGSASPGAAEQYGLDSLPLVQGQPALEEPAAADGTPPTADSDSPVSGLFRWCGWLLGAAVLAPWQQFASRRKAARQGQEPQ